MNKPLVSIIIPAYNHENYIENCLDSIINQTYENIELIILNDGSTDNTNEIIRKYEDRLKKCFIEYAYINKENEGVCRTLNKGLEISKGKYIIPFASDDVMFPNRVERQVDYMENNSQYGMVYTDGYYIESNNYINTDEDFEENRLFSRRIEFKEGNLFYFMLNNFFYIPTPTVCIKRECYDKVGVYDENTLCEDLDIFIQISRHFEIGSIKEPLTIHRLHDNNNGRKRSVLEPSIISLKDKYRKSNFLNENEKEFFLASVDHLLATLDRAIGTISMEKLIAQINNKKLIVWGTGGAYHKFKMKYNVDLEYFIDSDPSKTGNILDGKKIFDASKLDDINKEEYYILVLSIFYRDIYKALDNYGFSFLDNYF